MAQRAPVDVGVHHWRLPGVEKWLSYRERTVLGRALTLDEVRDVTHMARRIAAILLLEAQLDASYAACLMAAYVRT